MKKFLSPLIFIITSLYIYNSYANSIDKNHIENELYNMLQTAYIKENIISYELRHLINQTKNYTDILKSMNLHRENINILNKIMLQHSLKLPVVKIDVDMYHQRSDNLCLDILNLKKELVNFYNSKLRLLNTFQKNESIGCIIEGFEKLKNNIDKEDFYIIYKDFVNPLYDNF